MLAVSNSFVSLTPSSKSGIQPVNWMSTFERIEKGSQVSEEPAKIRISLNQTAMAARRLQERSFMQKSLVALMQSENSLERIAQKKSLRRYESSLD